MSDGNHIFYSPDMPKENLKGDEGMFQVHWEKVGDPGDTIFVAQIRNLTSQRELWAWVSEVCQRRGDEAPPGYWPVVINSTSERFVRTVFDAGDKRAPASP